MKQLVLLLSLLLGADCYKILGIFGHPGHSHYRIFEPILRGLSDKGHNLTVFAYFPSTSTKDGYRSITLKQDGAAIRHFFEFNANMRHGYTEKYWQAAYIIEYAKQTCDFALSSKEYRDLLESDESYDLIITELFNTNCVLLPIVERYKVPFVGLQSHAVMSWTNNWNGNPNNPSYIPNVYLGEASPMTFFQRVENLLMVIFDTCLFEYGEEYKKEMIKRMFGDKFSLPSDTMLSTSLILANSHFTIHGARPLVPNLVEIGGVHVGKAKPLPKHIDKWINESKHGVIYFSLGSMIKGHTFPDDKKQMFINAFGRLPQRVLWKWENETMPGKTDNIMIEKWMPQFDILCHPNVKAFIAHGGMLGVTEAVHCGVPMIIMPQFGDQFTNAKAVEASGGGTILDYRYLDEESIYNALTTALDPKSNKKAKELSARFKDRPLPPLETAIYWIEYVARHGGAPHLRTAAVGMPLYQYLLLDVIAFLVVILFSFLFVVYYISRAILRKLCRRKQSSQKKKKH
uniref:UDP-glucuronosyltransferase n=1 Tax=Photinus pyralis TaxID=7054 RepID=A0A1Y1LMI4_PHOPY